MADKPTVLIVDDEAIVASTTKAVLETSMDCEVLACTSPDEGIKVMHSREIAVLLCDLQMPGIDGTAVIKAAYDANPRTVSIMITARATTDGIIKAINEGNLWKCIQKPWRADELCSTVREAMDVYSQSMQTDTISRDEESVKEAAPDTEPSAGKKQIYIRRPRIRARRRKRTSIVPRIHVSSKGKLVQKKPTSKKKVTDSRYKNLTLLKEGGSGSIYKAEDTLLGTTVAIKILSDEFTNDKESMAILFQEARVAMQLSHKHIVRLHDIHETDGSYYLVMEYIDGDSLRLLLQEQGQLPPEMVLKIMDICADALGYAHRHEVYHRDLKPDNLMLSEDGILKIIDFGLACLATTVRDTRHIAGTPFYVSPEELKGTTLDSRADIFSLGIMIHELLSGDLPLHDGEETPDMFTYIPAASPDLPEAIRNVLDISFAQDPEDRWQDVHQFAGAFKQALALSHGVV